MDTKTTAILLLLPFLLQVAVVFAAPTTSVQEANSTSQTCDSSKISSYLLSIFKIRGKIVGSGPMDECSRLLTATFPGQTISPAFCSAERTTVGNYTPLPVPDHIARANKLFEEDEGSTLEEPERFCPSRVILSIQSFDVVEGADLALYKLPSLLSQSGVTYTVTVTDRFSGRTVMTKNVSSDASGWQIADISTYAKTKPFRKTHAFYLNIYVKRSDDGSHLTCQEMKSVFALDCAVAQEMNNFPFTEDILPALAVYKSGEFDLSFFLGKRSIESKRSINPLLGASVRVAGCKRVTNIVHLQDYVLEGYKVIQPLTVDQGRCISTRRIKGSSTIHAPSLCKPKETIGQWVVVKKLADGSLSIVKLKRFIAYKC